MPRQAEVLARVQQAADPVPVVFVGDSITQGWENEGLATWNERLVPLGAMNLGVGGDRTEHVLWRLEQAPLSRLQPRVIVLMIGTNNASSGRDSGAQIVQGIQSIVRLLQDQCPRACIVLVDIPPRGQAMNPVRGLVLQVNQALAATAWPEQVTWLACGDRFVQPDGSIDPGLMPDFLHLSPEGYRRWAQAIVPTVTALLDLKATPLVPEEPAAQPSSPGPADPPSGT
jgi:lysophospholipase L1-like esterase